MTGNDCSKCGANVTAPGVNWCPKCRAPMRASTGPAPHSPPPAAHIRPSPAVFKSAITSPSHAKTWLVLIGFAALAVCAGLVVYKAFIPSESQLHARAVSDALHLCQRAIASVAEYGAADTPPYTQNYGKQDEFYFAWPKGSFEFTNGFGAKVKMSASCNGKVSTGEITSLTVNGKDFR